MSDYLERLIQIKTQVPNAPEEVVIAAAVEGLTIGQCAAHFARNYPTTVKEQFKIMRQYARSDDDLKKRKATHNLWKQAGRAPRPPPTLGQRNMKPFHAINNLQEQPEYNPAEQGCPGPPPNQQYRSFDQAPRGGVGDEASTVDAMAEEGEETRGYLIVSCVVKTHVISQKTAKTTKWLESLRRKTKLRKAAKHPTMCSTTPLTK